MLGGCAATDLVRASPECGLLSPDLMRASPECGWIAKAVADR